MHYYARKFFAPVIVSPYVSNNDLIVYGVSDLAEPIEDATLRIEMLTWYNGFKPIYTEMAAVSNLPAFSSTLLYHAGRKLQKRSVSKHAYNYGAQDYLFKVDLLSKNGSFLAPTNVLMPNNLFEVPLGVMGDAKIDDCHALGPKHFRVTVSATAITPFIWLDVREVKGYFSDNGFVMVDPIVQIDFYAWKSGLTLDQFKKALSLTYYRKWYD